jgi:hypothetical protein
VGRHRGRLVGIAAVAAVRNTAFAAVTP